ncbi:MAG: hypothetical protein R3D51_02015 [Hyphomicrobiaceae bacterium]
MTLLSVVAIAVACLVAVVALNPRLMRAPLWRATVTPLASIIGSGFLVAGPILAHATGNWAFLSMAALCVVAYVFGFAIRRNIALVEPLLEGDTPRALLVLERVSEFALAFAYFVSVAYYLNLFAAFVLRGFGIVDEHTTRTVSSAVIIGIGIFGAVRGLHGLETIEETAVGIKLSLISGLLSSLALAAFMAMSSGTFQLSSMEHATGLGEIRVLLGLIILVQGFETSRYLGASYDRPTRIKTMRYAQWISTIIYIVFILLITPYFQGALPEKGGETAIIDLLKPLGTFVPPLLIIAAIASQLSAAVADMNGAGGMLHHATKNRLPLFAGYLATAGVALLITWSGNIYEIIVLASKAFVIYYALQCIMAALVALRPGPNRNVALAVLFGLATLLAIAILAYGIPAEA